MQANVADRLRSNLRFARFIAKSAYIAQYKLRAGQNLGPGLLLERHAKARPTATALFFEDERYDYRTFDERANQMANSLLTLGAKRGDVIAVLLDNRPELLFAVAGANKIGVCCAMINTSVVGMQLEHVLTIAKPTFVLVGVEHAAKLGELGERVPVAADHVLVVADRGQSEPAAPVAFRSMDETLANASRLSPGTATTQSIEAPCVYIYTSGTTGLPKAAAMKNGRFLKAAALFSSAVLSMKPTDVLYGAGLPLYHSSGLILGWGSALVAGAGYGLRRKFSASGHWEDIARWDATVFTYIGELCRYLLNAPSHPRERTHKLRAIVGAGMRPDIWERFQERFNVPVVYEFYGATEGNVGIVNVDGRPGMMGRLLPGQTVVKADAATGELVRDEAGKATKVAPGDVGLLLGQINKMSSFDGYVDRSKNDSKLVRDAFGDGKDYFNTGDLVQLHPDGYVSFRDRTGDTFRWKGENVSTNEVQETLNRCAGVLESNVYGVEIPGADGRAGMVALSADESFDVAQFAEHVRSSLPVYARPLFLRVQPQIAKTGTFKQVKTELREQGCDPSRVADSLYFYEEGARYVPLTGSLYATITSGKLRL
jgi:acyl-CoA synthetase (AMP-forming)/AMP-acid ligase II